MSDAPVAPPADSPDAVCEHGVAMDVHCCNCHGGFLFDADSCVCVFEDEDDNTPVPEGTGDTWGPPLRKPVPPRPVAPSVDRIAQIRQLAEADKHWEQDDADADVLWLLDRLVTVEAERDNQRMLGHGEGQEHTIADANAGRIDDLIMLRLQPLIERAEHAEATYTALRAQLEEWLAQGYTVNETPLDGYGAEVIQEVLTLLADSEGSIT